jgi:hypothetical protein
VIVARGVPPSGGTKEAVEAARPVRIFLRKEGVMQTKLYHIMYDGVAYFVVAETLAVAIELWKNYMAAELKEDYGGTEEPESCALIHDGPVIGHVGLPMAS